MRIPATIILSIWLTAPAVAGWQQTEWGMSQSDTLQAVPNSKLEGSDSVSATTKVSAFGGLRTVDLSAKLHFQQDSLQVVELSHAGPGADDCPLLLAIGLATYGAALESRASVDASLYQWRDNTNANLVQLFTRDDLSFCTLVYLPLPEPNGAQSL